MKREPSRDGAPYAPRGFNWILIAFLAIAAFYLFAEYRAHLLGALPFLLLLACPFQATVAARLAHLRCADRALTHRESIEQGDNQLGSETHRPKFLLRVAIGRNSQKRHRKQMPFLSISIWRLKMKKSLLVAVLVTLPLSMPLAWADEDHHSDKNKKSATTMTDKDKQMQAGKMQESMLKMHDQMHKIMDAKNPQERARLTQEHSKMMQEHMQMMHGMMGDHGAMGGDAKGGKMEGGMKGM